jgi:plasmid segregation protein ParM
MSLPVLAIDVGFGNTKWAFPKDEKLVFDSFRSMAAVVDARPPQVDTEKSMDLFYFERNGALYAVGKAIETVPTATLSLGDDYAMTDRYWLLTMAALSYAAEEAGVVSVDRLVLGLPVNTFREKRDVLKTRFVGNFDLTDRMGRESRLTVGSCMVVPQPVGAYTAWSSQNPGKPALGATLVLDVGEYTFDWIVVQDNAVNYMRSGAINWGMSAIHRDVAAMFNRKLGTSDVSLEVIRRGLTDGSVMFRGREVAFDEYQQRARTRAAEVFKDVIGRIHSIDDIQTVLLVGGGAEFFSQACTDAFGQDILASTRDPMFANVEGFYAIGARGPR